MGNQVFDLQLHNTIELEKMKSVKDNENMGKRKRQNDEVGVQSMKMLKVRAALEEKLKQKGVFKSITPRTDRPQKHQKPLDGKLESYDDSEDDFYEQAKKNRAAKLAAKADMHSRPSAVQSLPDIVDGKRHITYQMEKNRGLTRSRKKDLQNPRKKYKVKHEKKVKSRKGQVRDVKKPKGSYAGETSGINPSISRSVRF